MKFPHDIAQNIKYQAWHKKLVKVTGSASWDYNTLNVCYPELAQELKQIVANH